MAEKQQLVDELKVCFPAVVFIECTAAIDVIKRERRRINRVLEKIHNMELEPQP